MTRFDTSSKKYGSLPIFITLSVLLLLITVLLTTPETMATEASGRWLPKKMAVQAEVTLSQLAGILKRQKIEAKSANTDEVEYLIFRLSGNKSIIALYQCQKERCGTIKMSTFFKPSKPVGPKRINTWNQTRRYTRVYLDKDGDPVMEADVDLDGGAPLEAVEGFVLRQRSMIAQFAKYVGLPAKDDDLYAWQEAEGDPSMLKAVFGDKKKPQKSEPTQPTKPKTIQPDQPKEDQSGQSGPDLSTFVQSEGHIYLTVLKLDGDNPQGCPVIIEASNKTRFNLNDLQLAVRIHIKDPAAPWSVDRLYDYPAIARDGVEMDYKFGGDGCDQIGHVEIIAVRKAMVEGQPFPGLVDVIKEGQGGFVSLTVAEEVE